MIATKLASLAYVDEGEKQTAKPCESATFFLVDNSSGLSLHTGNK